MTTSTIWYGSYLPVSILLLIAYNMEQNRMRWFSMVPGTGTIPGPGKAQQHFTVFSFKTPIIKLLVCNITSVSTHVWENFHKPSDSVLDRDVVDVVVHVVCIQSNLTVRSVSTGNTMVSWYVADFFPVNCF